MATPDPLAALTALAVAAFRSRQDPATHELKARLLSIRTEPLIDEAMRFSLIAAGGPLPGQEATLSLLLSERDLGSLGPREGELDPMVMWEDGGGVRQSFEVLVIGLLTAALQQIFFLRLPEDEETFVRIVLENFSELRRAVRGEKVRAYHLVGFGGVRIPVDKGVVTPWGTVRTAPDVPANWPIWGVNRRTTLLLAIPTQLAVRFDRSPQPENIQGQSSSVRDRAIEMLPLAFTLATSGAAAPAITWYTIVGPFATAFSYASPFVMVLPGEVELGATDLVHVESWCRLIDERHSPAIDVAARRLVSAAARRVDPADKLIDSVMVWENLVGTRGESTFRVTAALVKLLEPDKSKRVALRKELVELYEVRSRVVHGDLVENRSVADAADRSLQYAVKGLQKFYADHSSWLSLTSQERADRLLLEEP